MWRPKIIVGGLVSVSLIMLGAKIDMDNILPIKSVKIVGEFNYLNKNKLQNHVMPVVNGGFFNVDLPSVRQKLLNLEWVENVSVRRQWPNQLVVRVIEKQPVVYWGKTGVLSAKGKLFNPYRNLIGEMPVLKGPEGQHKIMLKEFSRMQAWLLNADLHIRSIDLNDRRSWVLSMNNGMELRLGRENMHERLNRFVTIYINDFKHTKNKIKHIDMRYTNGFSIAWKEA